MSRKQKNSSQDPPTKKARSNFLSKKKLGDNVAHGINNLSVKLERKIPQDCNANKICMFERGDH
jgi:hypothetical protein